MRLIVATEAHFMAAPDGRIYSDTGGRAYDFWARYLEVFDSVAVVARVSASSVRGAALVEGPGVSLVALPGYHGPEQYIRSRGLVRRRIRDAYQAGMACLSRVPGPLGTLLIREAARARRPYGLEVVGDPSDALARGAFRHPLRSLIRAQLTSEMRRACLDAAAVAYVTEIHLQRRYPASSGAFVTHYSSVELDSRAFVQQPREYEAASQRATLIHVGTHSQAYKGQDVLIDAVARCVRNGLDLELVLIGDGRHRSEFERRATVAGVRQRVRFLGQLPSGSAVREQLDRADLFVMPSRTEGLPRAMIEAMARGLPCIASNVGGIPELLAPDDLVPPGDAEALGRKISEVLANPDRMRSMSTRNVERAREYDSRALRLRRISFYEALKARTADADGGVGFDANG